jgi:hypothetical protein
MLTTKGNLGSAAHEAARWVAHETPTPSGMVLLVDAMGVTSRERSTTGDGITA